MSEDYRTESRKNWHRKNAEADTDDLKLGCLQRIADATERMAENYIALQNDLEMYKRWYEEGRSYQKKLERRITSLRGVITRLKKRLDAEGEQ